MAGQYELPCLTTFYDYFKILACVYDVLKDKMLFSLF